MASSTGWLAMLVLLALACAAQQDDGWTHRDQEEGDDDASRSQESGDGQSEQAPGTGAFLFVTRTKNGTLSVASAADVAELEAFVTSHRSERARLVTKGPTQLEDGPMEDDKSHQSTAKSDRSGTISPGLTAETAVYFYPQYAIGQVENGCTGFMISSKHALTSAACVLGDGASWRQEIDMRRGKLRGEMLQHLKWSHVTVMNAFYEGRDERQNWALITFSKHSKSPVWLEISSSATSYSDQLLILYGYKSDGDVMYSSYCTGSQQSNETELVAVNCEANVAFPGAPLLENEEDVDKETPPVIAVSSSASSALRIHEDLFWTLCYMMQKEGEDVGCS